MHTFAPLAMKSLSFLFYKITCRWKKNQKVVFNIWKQYCFHYRFCNEIHFWIYDYYSNMQLVWSILKLKISLLFLNNKNNKPNTFYVNGKNVSNRKVEKMLISTIVSFLPSMSQALLDNCMIQTTWCSFSIVLHKAATTDLTIKTANNWIYVGLLSITVTS